MQVLIVIYGNTSQSYQISRVLVSQVTHVHTTTQLAYVQSIQLTVCHQTLQKFRGTYYNSSQSGSQMKSVTLTVLSTILRASHQARLSGNRGVRNQRQLALI